MEIDVEEDLIEQGSRTSTAIERELQMLLDNLK